MKKTYWAATPSEQKEFLELTLARRGRRSGHILRLADRQLMTVGVCRSLGYAGKKYGQEESGSHASASEAGTGDSRESEKHKKN